MISATDRTSLADQVLACLNPLRGLARLARRINVNDFEEEQLEQAERLLRPLLARTLGLARGLLEQIQELTENNAGADELDWADLAGAAGDAAAGSSRGRVADVCSLARLQLAQRLEQLDHPLESADLWAFSALCNQCRGNIVQAVSAVEGAVAAWLGLAVELDLSADLENSIRVRQAYQHFHATVCAGGELTLVEVQPRLNQARAAAARLMDSPFVSELRIADRAQLRRLNEMMTTWLEAGPTADPLAGMRLWSDVRALAEIMLQVNNRQDLIEHDRAALLRLLDLFYNQAASIEARREDVQRELARISGRDFELDELVQRGEPLASTAFLRAITRAAIRLGAGEAHRVILRDLP